MFGKPKMAAAAGSKHIGSEGKFIQPSIWLSLSGGGFRAAIFHFGCLNRLYEVGLLGHVSAISATSGGALIAALLHRYLGNLYKDEDKNILLHQFEWEAFERDFLHLVRKGVFAPTALLVLAYICYAIHLVLYEIWVLSFWPSHDTLQRALACSVILSLIGGITLHLTLAYVLFAERAYAPLISAPPPDTEFGGEWTRRSIFRLFRMLFVPSYLRWQTLNLRAFRGELLNDMHTAPSLFLTAVDLNSGKEMVFTSGLFADLGPTGCRELWEQRTERPENEAGSIETAQAVCASSAFPPLFRPVSIYNWSGLVGVFVDGGVLDNIALNVPRALAAHIHPLRKRYDGSVPSFRESTSFILAMDGGNSPGTKRRTGWGRIRCAKRLISILLGQQSEAALLATTDLTRNAGIDCTIVGLKVGFPFESELYDEQLNRYLSDVRTHFDSFSLEECAAIAYCGYLWANYFITKEEPQLLERYERVQWKDLTSFENILPKYCGEWERSLDGLRNHFRYSNRRLGLLRMLGRRFGI